MPHRPPFTVRESLVRSDGLALYRGVWHEDQRPVLLEVGAAATEYELARGLSAHSVLKPIRRTTYRGLPTLVLEDFEGVALKSLLDHPMPLALFLPLAVGIAEALSEIHRDGVVHRDMKPDNILVDPQTAAVRITGFALATRLPREAQAAQTTQLIQGSLPYMSPEQTGRMNRALDQRSDLYSLGVTFYQMLTGRLPFEAGDPVEWVYCHVAREPVAPIEHVTELPRVLSDVVLKLLAKVAEARYQSARGLAADLGRCLEQWTRTGKITPFSLGERDVSERFRSSERFYDREPELRQLIEAFERVVTTGKSELVLVAGYSGMGKSSLVHELHRPIVRQRGSFITGKADQYSHGVPYSTIVSGLSNIVLEILSKNEAGVRQTRRDLQAALGANARLVVDTIPKAELLLGEQPPTISLPPAEAKQRFLSTFQKFFSVFATKEHPLTLFLDDLQWADAASIELLQYLITQPDTKYLFAIGAYRDNEVTPSHPLVAMIKEVRETGARVSDVHLHPLSSEHLTQFVADSVHESCEATAPLARLIHEKTYGNPFFTIQFMNTLVRDGLLKFDTSSLSWRWSVGRIEARDYTDNVVDLMVDKIELLPKKTRSVLQLAACVGTLVDARTLALISNESEPAVHRALGRAVQEGLLLRSDRSYRFLHDRIQQAAYSLVAKSRRAEFQLTIGRTLLLSPQQRDEHFFDIANHFLLGLPAIVDPVERLRSARLFLKAGKRAKAATAYERAVTFLAAGVELLEADSWSSSYELTYTLCFELAECQWLSGNFDAAERAIPPLLSHSHTTTEKLRVYGIWVRVLMICTEPEKAAKAGLSALRLIGVDFRLHPRAADVKEGLDLVWELLGERTVEELLDLPPMTNAEMSAALDLVSLIFDIAYFVDWNLHSLLSCFAVSSSLRHGNSPSSFMGYAVFAIFLCDCGRYAEAYRFGRVAYASLERPTSKRYAAKICALVGACILDSWTQPYRSGLAYLERGCREGAESGDPLFGSYCSSNFVRTLFMAGEPLADVDRECNTRFDYLRKTKYDDVADHLRSLKRFVNKLRGLPPDPTEGDDLTFDERIEGTRTSSAIGIHFTWRLQEGYLFGDYERALSAAAHVERHFDGVRGMIQSAEFQFYRALTLAALHGAVSNVAEADLVSMTACERQYQVWAKSCPENFASQHALVAGEISRVVGREVEAERSFDEAILLAREAGLVHIEALANEVAARFHRARGLSSIAKLYLREACVAYRRWGADAKVRELERHYPELLEGASECTSIASQPERLDLMSVIKASQTLSGELELEGLIERLTRIVLEQSGAQSCHLLLVHDDELRIEAEARAAEGMTETRLVSESATGSDLVSESIVQYVRRTCERVILADACNMDGTGRFRSDAYIARVRPKSVLCLPIMRSRRVVGVLYLENNLLTDAFTPERVAVLDVLASQAVIALEVAFWIRQEQCARTALERSESRFRRVSDSNMIGIIFCDRSGLITEANDYFLDMVGHTREDLVARRLRWTDLTPPEYALLDENASHELDESGVCRPFEKEYVLTDGRRVPILLGLALLEGSKSETVAYILDMTERKRTERERDRLLAEERRARSEAERSLHARDEFLSIAAHELRTPLTPLKMQLELLMALARSKVPAVVASELSLLEMLEKSSAQVDRLAKLIEVLLDISKIRTEHMALTLETTNLSSLVCEIVERSRAEFERAGCTVELRADREVVGQWDPFRLEQVVVNLLTNAMKYGAGKPIEIEVARRGAKAKLSIRDYGIGIEAKDHGRIFDRFERAVSLRHFGGFGLGLYIAREIVRAHSGTIAVESCPGAGATFVVKLPIESRTPIRSRRPDRHGNSRAGSTRGSISPSRDHGQRRHCARDARRGFARRPRTGGTAASEARTRCRSPSG